MTRMLAGLGDRMLGFVLKEVGAGACVPDVGLRCGPCQYYAPDCFCQGYGDVKICYDHAKVYNCSGACVWASSRCSSTKYYADTNCP